MTVPYLPCFVPSCTDKDVFARRGEFERLDSKSDKGILIFVLLASLYLTSLYVMS